MEENLDYKRHFGELFRLFLPIFVIVGAIVIVLVVVYGDRTEKVETVRLFKDRYGLLDAKNASAPLDPAMMLISPIEMASTPVVTRFDAPLGSEHAALTYNAQPFLTTRHLGDDLNGIGGWDSDLGDPVYAVADGLVVFAGWPADGWGNIVILLHRLPNGKMIETFYGHLQSIQVPINTQVRRGEPIGTVGKADGRYLAHLHFEIRESSTLSAGAGYADTPLGRVSGEWFLEKWRGAPVDQLNPAVAAEPVVKEEGSLKMNPPQ